MALTQNFREISIVVTVEMTSNEFASANVSDHVYLVVFQKKD
jgi:hypothetical protein